jgi:1-acyl-sn-glycerol-3-phosphate acyltransferase
MAVRKFVYPHLNFLTKIGFIDFIYKLFGVFVVVPGLGVEENLKEAIYIIKNGGNVVIYPEGKIVKKDSVAPFKRGAAVLELKTGAGVLPISFRITGVEGRARKQITAHIGEPIWIPEGMTEDEITQVFYNSIVSLYERE